MEDGKSHGIPTNDALRALRHLGFCGKACGRYIRHINENRGRTRVRFKQGGPHIVELHAADVSGVDAIGWQGFPKNVEFR